MHSKQHLGAAQKKTAGQVLSELARKGLTQAPAAGFGEPAPADFVMEGGWYQLPNREGVVVTKELVDRLIEEADEEEARRKGGY